MSATGPVSRRKSASNPLRKVVSFGVGSDPEQPALDVDVLECGHVLMGAQDMIGRRYPARRRCFKCRLEAERTGGL